MNPVPRTASQKDHKATLALLSTGFFVALLGCNSKTKPTLENFTAALQQVVPSPEISSFTRYVIQCLLGSVNREWMPSPSCGIAGRSSIVFSQRYIHPTPEAVERAFERLQLSGTVTVIEPKRRLTATVFATVERKEAVSH